MPDKKKIEGELRRERVLYKAKNGYELISADEEKDVEQISAQYKAFLNNGKTERECVDLAVRMAEGLSFKPFTRGSALKAGDAIYSVNRGKYVILTRIGREPLSAGLNVIASHIDVPRIDLKTNPLYEDSKLAYFKTHYYGGIRKHQWPAIPLELRGVVAKKDGTVLRIDVGSRPEDPVLMITDLLPHLAADQAKKVLSEAFTGEDLNVLLGSRPAAGDEGEERVKLAVMELLHGRYGVTERDFASAELSLVPAFPARDVGLDSSMIGGYGHDDRVCGFTSLRAILDAPAPARTALCVLADKEEIGSEGVSGMKSFFFDTFVGDLCAAQGGSLNECYENSCCLSADVTVAFDPNFPEVSDKRNNAHLNYGLGITKYTGTRGKGGSSDASAELVARIRRVFDEGGVLWQMGPLGKVDQGGGGTVAMYMANRNIDTIDAGVPVLSMHSPFEVVGKLDTYMAYKGFKAFYASKP